MTDTRRLVSHFDIDSEDIVTDVQAIHQNCKYNTVGGFSLGQGFSILHLNARSLKNKMNDFLTLLSSSGVEWSVICVSETWLKMDILQYFNIDGIVSLLLVERLV